MLDKLVAPRARRQRMGQRRAQLAGPHAAVDRRVMGGRQPLVNDGEDVWLVGNGEVYNHAEVRAGLDPEHTFVTDSDNEVALHLIEERGPLGLAELNGMFAFVMAAADGRFVAARDPVGIKPLYWAQRGERTRFASEMAAFDEEWQRLVEPFPPGCAWTPQDGLIRFARAVPDGLEWMPGPTTPGAAAPPSPARHARRADRRRRAPAHGRRAGRRVPLRRPGLEPRRGDRAPRSSPSAASACRRSPSAPRLAGPRRRAPGRRAHRLRAPRDDVHRRGRARRHAGRGARDRVLRPRARAQRGAELHALGVHRPAHQGRADRRGRRRAVRRLRVPARLHRPGDAAPRARADRREPAQPQPAALRPRDDGPRPRGARAVPRPRGHRVGAAPAAGLQARRPRPAREAAAARGVRRLAAATSCCGATRPSSATAAAPRTC